MVATDRVDYATYDTAGRLYEIYISVSTCILAVLINCFVSTSILGVSY